MEHTVVDGTIYRAGVSPNVPWKEMANIRLNGRRSMWQFIYEQIRDPLDAAAIHTSNCERFGDPIGPTMTWHLGQAEREGSTGDDAYEFVMRWLLNLA